MILIKIDPLLRQYVTMTVILSYFGNNFDQEFVFLYCGNGSKNKNVLNVNYV